MDHSVRLRLTNCLANASKADRAIARYMLAHINTIPFETAATLGTEVNVSEATVGRFCRSLGYRSFKDLKVHLKQDLGAEPWVISDRLRNILEHTQADENQLARSLPLEIAGVVAVYELVQTDEWKRVVKRLVETSTVFVMGFRNERGMAQLFVDQLRNLRDHVHLLDLASGDFSELLASDSGMSYLVTFGARPHSRLAQLVVQETKQAGIPVTLITDAYCDWGKELVDEIFVVPTEFSLFLESNAQMACLANLLVNGVFNEIGPAGVEQLKKNNILNS